MGDAARKLNDPGTSSENTDVAEAGIEDWFDSLPKDDWTGALDESAFTPVRWVDGLGFVEVPA